jgi:hypothetical protein
MVDNQKYNINKVALKASSLVKKSIKVSQCHLALGAKLGQSAESPFYYITDFLIKAPNL